MGSSRFRHNHPGAHPGGPSAQPDLLGHLDLDDLAVLHDEQHGPELELAEHLGDAQEDGTLLVGERLEPLDRRVPLAVHAATLPVPGCPRGALPCRLAERCEAYASGAGPPGPGKIPSRRARASSSSLISIARIEPSSCSIVRGPMIGAVTTGLASNQARPTSAGFSPRSAQNFSYASTLSRRFSSSSLMSSLARRPPSIFSRTPPSNPPASGLQGITPIP